MTEKEVIKYLSDYELYQHLNRRIDHVFAFYVDLRNYMQKIAFVLGIGMFLIVAAIAVLFTMVLL